MKRLQTYGSRDSEDLLMLAGLESSRACFGVFGAEVQLPATSLFSLLDFIREELPRWRDDPQRQPQTAETALTSQLCEFLNNAARMSAGWDILQFRTEVFDERYGGRHIDLAPKPCGTTIFIGQQRYTKYDTLLPIECKRLPIPRDKKRDEREYVTSEHATVGGIQRFKSGLHGGAHTLGAMIGYLQGDTRAQWIARIGGWIDELVGSGQPGWTAEDLLHLIYDDDALRMATLRSSHARQSGLTDIELRHIWIQMN